MEVTERVCQCGREIGPRAHCPVCGTIKCYLLLKQKDTVTRPSGKSVELRVWRCTGCGHKFNDDDWQLRCQAQPRKLGRPPAVSRAKPPQPAPEILEDPAVRAVLEEFRAEQRRKGLAEQEAESRRKSPLEVFNQAKTGD